MAVSTEFSLRFAASFAASQGSYRLLELPPELFSIIERGGDTQFTIRGRTTDDAVLCTAAHTYSLRAVTLSNSFLVTTGDSDTTDMVVRDEVSQILELVPSVPKLHRIKAMLRGCEYEEGHEEDAEFEKLDEDDDEEGRPRKRARITQGSLREEIQASELELAQGLRGFHILEIDGHLHPLPPAYLTRILEALLTALVAEGHPLPPNAAPATPLAQYLDLEHDVPYHVVMQVLVWFGALVDEKWTMDVRAVVREIGLGHLITHKGTPVTIVAFLDEWRSAVGDTFTTSVELELLKGNYLLTPPLPSTPTHLVYFPASELPTTATQLFADLFAMQTRWRATDMMPFLGTIATEEKERDKLLMKYTRATIDAEEGVWYTARASNV